MVLRIKNFKIVGVHWKIRLLGRGGGWGGGGGGGGGAWETNIEGGLGQFVHLRKGLARKGSGGVFEGGWYPNAHYELLLIIQSAWI